MTTKKRTRAVLVFAALAMAIHGLSAAKEIPAQLPDPDSTPPVTNKPVKVYILSGQSNMVGMGDIRGRSSRWGNQFLDPVVSIYAGEYSPTADYDKMTPIETKKLPAFGGIKPTPFPGGGTAVVRGFIKMSTTGVYKFNSGYSNSSYNIMQVDGTEVYRKEPGKEAVHTEFKFTAGKKYPFKITFLTKAANGLGWLWRTDIPGTLNTVVRVDKKFSHLVDDKGNWTVRNDVMYKGVVSATAKGPLTVGLQGNTIGPELQFGHIMGYYHDEPVLLIKASIGNRSLAWDILPPGSERYTIDGTTYAGYKDGDDHWSENDPYKDIKVWYAGKQYDDFVREIHGVLDNFGTLFPAYKDQGYEIAGFAWWQGHKDGNAAHASRYELNLVNLIKAFRSEFNAPKAPFVIGTIGFGGWKMAGHHLTVANAQLAVSDPKKYPEFAGNVLTVETRDFWKDTSVSPSGQGYHYNRNAETYMMVGDALGRGMVELQTKPEKQASNKSITELQEDFLKLNFGMFIHYNMATYKGVEWVSGYHDPSTFNPGSKIDTDAWADAAVSAGMTYAVLTAKHVSGFCLWDSKYTTYDVMHPDCPYNQDLVAQFIKSFKSRGLKVGLYYCWRHPGFGDAEKYKVLPPECDPATHTLEEQKEFQKAQIAELLTKYPDVSYIWNDALDPKVMPADEILTHIRSIRPNAIVSANWWNWGKKGTPYVDIAVKELRHFPEGNGVPGETCWCLEQKWFWKEGSRSKTTGQIVALMTTANSRNSNFLLNVGPDRNGSIVESSIRTLAEIGKLWKPNATSTSPNVETGTNSTRE